MDTPHPANRYGNRPPPSQTWRLIHRWGVGQRNSLARGVAKVSRDSSRLNRPAHSASRPPRNPGGRVQGIAAASGGFEVDCSFVAVRLNQFRRDCVQASKFRENHPACWGQRMRFNLFPDVIFQVHDSAPRAEYASAAATCQGQDAGLAVCVVWNLDGRFADSFLVQDLTP